MPWFLIGLIAPALWATSNHIDKYLLSKYFKGAGTGALILFSALFGGLVMPLVFLFNPEVTQIAWWQLLLMVGNGALGVVAVLLYLYAMQEDEASNVVPLFQTMPVLMFILGAIFLHETLSSRELGGASLIIAGAVIISIKFSDTFFKLRTKVLTLMLLSSLILAVGSLIFKIVAFESDYWTTVFWYYFGCMLFGIGLFMCVGKYRREFLENVRQWPLFLLALNALNETITILGGLVLSFITLVMPLALAQVINGFQPVFVLVYGIILSKLFPKIVQEGLGRKELFQKVLAIAIMLIGTFLINS
jgi:drug/metabolite transporter (DMT)-like permease